MGIPKFYRWLSERYPLLNQRFSATDSPPDIDNLYLDMNGIIHNCTHANQKQVKLSEEDMMLRIFDYIDKLVQIIRPRKLLFMAIDGVAPRAKMNQQRSRRFKAAKERLETQEALRAKGEEVPADAFDSNCITPGTPFMERLGKHLRFFIRRKMSSDPLWQTPAVVFSGHEVPGEGEHKIMEYLRWERKGGHYAPNQRHCLYGLDADLIMLSLVTHEPHFCLLREVVSYTGGNRGQPAREVLENPCTENFVLFHIGLLREYLELEFSGVAVPFEAGGVANPERLVDDFVLFCMLIGNDFLPALPTLDIAEGALNTMMELYKKLLAGPQGGYLTHAGELDRRRLELLLAALGTLEKQVLEDRAKDAEFFENKRAKRNGGTPAWVPPSRNGAEAGGSGHRNGGRGSGSAAPVVAAGPNGQGAGFGGGRGTRNVGAAATLFTAEALKQLQLAEASGEASSPAVGAPDPTEDDVVDEAAATQPAAPPELDLAPFFQVTDAVGAAVALGVALEDEAEETAVPAPAAAEPTMMSREARALFTSGQGAQGLELWKDRWYRDKLHAHAPSDRRAVAEAYLQGLHWVLEYYYRGVASWEWFYPHHYAPMASDLVDLESIEVHFVQGKPFRPFEQLMGVLPAASASLLPAAYKPLMTDPTSPILHFYPPEFQVDTEGKRADWEGIVLIPFVDQNELLHAMRVVEADGLSNAERARNSLGDILIFTHDPDSKDTEFCHSTMPKMFGDVTEPRSRLRKRAMPPPLPSSMRGFEPTLIPGTTTGLGAPQGFPTLKSIQVRADLRKVGVNVLGTASKKESLLLVLPGLGGGQRFSAAALAPRLLDKRCYINWPYLQEARIVRVSDAGEQWYSTGHSAPQQKKWQSQEAATWQTDAGAMAGTLLTRHGLDVGRVQLVLHVLLCKGYMRHLDGTVEKQYAAQEVTYPLQCVLRVRPGLGAAAGGAAGQSPDAEEDALPPWVVLGPGDRALFIGKQHYACVATILPHDVLGQNQGDASTYRVSIEMAGPGGGADPMARAALQMVTRYTPRYMPSSEAARRLHLDARVLGRITCNVWVTDADERYDVGLAVRAPSKGLCVPGFCVPTPDGNGWAYSPALLTLLEDYRAAHGWLFDALLSQARAPDSGGATLRLGQLLPDVDREERVARVAGAAAWVRASPLGGRSLVKSSVQMLADEGVKMLQLAVPPQQPKQTVEFENVPPALLLPPFIPGPNQVKVAAQGGHFELGDRVVCVLRSGIPPFGLRGTVTGVFEDALEVVFDVDFPGGSNLGGRVNGRCGAHVPKDVVVNASRPVTVPLNTAHIPRPASAPGVVTTVQGLLQSHVHGASVGGRGGRHGGAGRGPGPRPASGGPPVQPPVPSASMLSVAQGGGGKQHVPHPQQHRMQSAPVPKLGGGAPVQQARAGGQRGGGSGGGRGSAGQALLQQLRASATVVPPTAAPAPPPPSAGQALLHQLLASMPPPPLPQQLPSMAAPPTPPTAHGLPPPPPVMFGHHHPYVAPTPHSYHPQPQPVLMATPGHQLPGPPSAHQQPLVPPPPPPLTASMVSRAQQRNGGRGRGDRGG